MPDDTHPPDLPSAPPLDALPRTGDVVFTTSGGDSWTYARLAHAAGRLAAGFAAQGIGPGDRVALHLRNGPEIAAAYLACFRTGAVAAPLGLRFKQGELADVLRRLQPRLYLGHPDLYANVAPIDPAVLAAGARFVAGTPGAAGAQDWTALHANPHHAPEPGSADKDAPAVLLMTSGTTGEPKFVAHSLNTLAEASDRFRHLGLGAGSKVAFFLPMAHPSGLFWFLSALRLRFQLAMCEADPDAILDTVERDRCDSVLALPATASLLVEAQRRRPRDVSSLRLCLTAGDVPPADQQAAFEAAFGAPLRSFWASTEAPGPFTWGLRPGPVSRLLPGTEMRLVDEQGSPVARGEAGEMLLRGPCVMLGYWRAPGALEGLEEGWYCSGDLMREEADSHVRFVGRKKDLIVRGGSNISPVEVEGVLARHPAVAEAAVVGVPDPVLGQRVVGFVRLRSGVGAAALPEVLAAAGAQLAEYKTPERLFPLAALPRGGPGKVDRRALVALAERELA